MLLKLNAIDGSGTDGWQGFALTTEGVVIDNCYDYDAEEDSGIEATYSGPAWTTNGSSGLVTEDHYGIPATVLRVWNSTMDTGGTLTLKNISAGVGFTIGSSYTVGFMAATNHARNTTATVNGVNLEYQNASQTTPITPNPPTVETVVATDDGTGKGQLVFTFSGSASYKYITLITVSSSATPAVDPSGVNRYGRPASYTVENFSGSITSATVAGIACTDVSDTGATMPALVDETSVPMPGERELEVSDGEDTATANIVLSPPSGFNSVILGDDLNTSDTGTIFEFVPAAKEGNALFTPFVVDSQGNIIDAPAGVYECWDLSVDENDPNVAVARSFFVTLGGGPDPDDRPDDVRFNTVNKADLNTEYESNTVEITGINVTVDVTISGGEYRIDDGEWGSAAGTIQNGQEIQLRANSPADKNQTTVVTINVGSATFKWRIHTERDSGGASQIPGMQVPTMRGLS